MKSYLPAETLAPDLLAKQRTLYRGHLDRFMFLAIGVFFVALAALLLLPSHLPIGIALLVADFVFTIYAGFILLPRADTRQCKQIGFICPSCEQPLYQDSFLYPRSALLTRGVCPHCEHPIDTTNVA